MFKKFFDMMKGGGDDGTSKENTVYTCKGGCGARLSEEEYQNHSTKVCGTEGCENKGKPFVSSEHKKDEHCEHCGNACKHCQA